jgi:hypothetical protein
MEDALHIANAPGVEEIVLLQRLQRLQVWEA